MYRPYHTLYFAGSKDESQLPRLRNHDHSARLFCFFLFYFAVPLTRAISRDFLVCMPHYVCLHHLTFCTSLLPRSPFSENHMLNLRVSSVAKLCFRGPLLPPLSIRLSLSPNKHRDRPWLWLHSGEYPFLLSWVLNSLSNAVSSLRSRSSRSPDPTDTSTKETGSETFSRLKHKQIAHQRPTVTPFCCHTFFLHLASV